MTNELIQQWTYYLDEKKEDYILIKITFAKDMNKLTEYVIIYLTLIEDKPTEILKYDGSEKEASHAHQNYSTKKGKVFQNKPVTFETIEEITNYLERNWRIIKAKYFENR